MRESKFVQELKDLARQDVTRQYIATLLKHRFGRRAAADAKRALAELTDSRKLGRLFDVAVTCTDLNEFQRKLRKAAQSA